MKLSVRNLNTNITAEDLKDVFRLAGPVLATGMQGRKPGGEGKRSGFVEMANHQAGINAISQFNGAQLDGTEMLVSEASDDYPSALRPSSKPAGHRDAKASRTEA